MQKTGTEAVASIVSTLCQQAFPEHLQGSADGDASMLGQLLLQQSACQKLQMHLQQSVEFWPATAVRVSHAQQHELVISCADGGAASRVRFVQNEILHAVKVFANNSSDAGARGLLLPVTRIRVVVRAGADRQYQPA